MSKRPPVPAQIIARPALVPPDSRRTAVAMNLDLPHKYIIGRPAWSLKRAISPEASGGEKCLASGRPPGLRPGHGGSGDLCDEMPVRSWMEDGRPEPAIALTLDVVGSGEDLG